MVPQLLIRPHELRWIESRLLDRDIQFVVIGGVAVKYYVFGRDTKDLDLFVDSDAGTIDRLIEAIPQLRADSNAKAKLMSEKVGHFSVEGDYAIDVLTFAPGISFEEASRTAEIYVQDGTSVPILSRSLLVAHKRAVVESGSGIAKPQDFEDIRLLAE